MSSGTRHGAAGSTRLCNLTGSRSGEHLSGDATASFSGWQSFGRGNPASEDRTRWPGESEVSDSPRCLQGRSPGRSGGSPVVQLAAALGGLVKLTWHRIVGLIGVAAALKHLADGMISESDR